MEKKKNEKYDLERKSPLFFFIGLIVALSGVTAAFEWRSEYDPLVLDPMEDHADLIFEVPITRIPEPEPPKPVEEKVETVKPEQIKDVVEVDNLDEIEKVLAVEPTDDVPLDPIVDYLPPEKPDEFVDFAEVMPTFPGGMDAFYKCIGKSIEYPARERRLGIEGRVFVRFIIDEEGNVTNVEVVRGISEGLDTEAIKALENSPKWKPGKQGSRRVKVRMVIPIAFSLHH